MPAQGLNTFADEVGKTGKPRVTTATMRYETDMLEEYGGDFQEIELIRCQYDLLYPMTPDYATPEVRSHLTKRIFELQKALKVVQTKSFMQIAVSQPYGLAHRCLTARYQYFWNDAVLKMWDENPIEIAEIAMVPANFDDRLLNKRLTAHTLELTLHFEAPSPAAILDVFTRNKFNVQHLRLINSGLSGRLLAHFVVRTGIKKVSVTKE